jgi:hypothetical protein
MPIAEAVAAPIPMSTLRRLYVTEPEVPVRRDALPDVAGAARRSRGGVRP